MESLNTDASGQSHPSRRQVIAGFAALSAGLLAQRAGAGMFAIAPDAERRPRPCVESGAAPLRTTNPFLQVGRHPESVMIGGLPFASKWLGDDFPNTRIPFHAQENRYPGGKPPEPTEEIDIAIVGGGPSGLTTAYLLRHRNPVVFELHNRFGGSSMGEEWGDIQYSMGSAYFIAPDEGSELEHLYRRLGITRVHADSPSTDDPTELGGSVVDDFWSGSNLPDIERQAFEQYRAMVMTYVDRYPAIPLDPTEDNTWIRDLDSMSLKDHIEATLTVPVPRLLETAINAYCFSSFNSGWEGISAACGWNFIAAEEFGRWVLPGGNAGMIEALWEKLLPLEAQTPRNCPPKYLRCGVRVVEVRVLGRDRVLVVTKDGNSVFRSMIAKRVVMACPKHVARWVLTEMRANDPDRFAQFTDVNTSAYVVANVLLNRPVQTHFYDLFMLRNGEFEQVYDPSNPLRITDVVNGAFARRGHEHTSVLTCYWPLSFGTGRFAIIADDAFEVFANRVAPELDAALNILHLNRNDIEQIRLTRWGHAMPIAKVGLISRGISEALREPWMDHVFFVNADNWSLPAVETCLEEALFWAPRIEAGL